MRCAWLAVPALGWRLGIVLALLWAGLPHASLGQEIAELREDVRTSNPPPPKPDTSGGSSGGSGGSGGSQTGEEDPFADSYAAEWLLVVGGAAVVVATAPFWGPAAIMGDSFGSPGYFPAYPHQHDVGYMLTSEVSVLGEDAPPRYPWAWRGRAEYGTNFSGLEWTGGGLLGETSFRLGLDADFRNYRERPPQRPRDDAWLGDLNLHYRIAQSAWAQVRTGLGMNYLADGGRLDVGFNFTYAADFYLLEPLVVSAELDWGTLGRSSLIHGRLTAGLQRGPVECYVGYDIYDIGPFDGGGLVAGLRLWF